MTHSQLRDYWNQVRYVPGNKGHYESYFFRANHPNKDLAFWVRYTIFSPKGNGEGAIGELWSIFFDGEKNQISAAKSEHPIKDCSFSDQSLNVDIAGSTACTGSIKGEIRGKNQLSWSLNYSEGDQPPLLLLQEKLYKAPIPKAKAAVGVAGTFYNGEFTVNGNTYDISDWIGSENHNWGEKHTDQYAWGQVAGFEEAPGVFLEAITGKVKVGPILSPYFSILVLRVNGEDHLFNSLPQAFKAKASYDFFTWNLKSDNGNAKINLTIKAKKEYFVGLNYYNPPGGSHTCLNCKIASCDLVFTPKNGESLTLSTASRAAFEILTDRTDHGVDVVA